VIIRSGSVEPTTPLHADTGLFPRGAAELVEHFSAVCDHRLVAQLAEDSTAAAHTVRERITCALRLRLAMNGEHISSWAQALSLQTHPSNAVHALRMRSALADEVWSCVGDTSSNMDWYAKRAALLGVYSASEVYMLSDTSPGFAATWAYADRLLEAAWEGSKLGAEVAQLSQTLLRRVGPAPR